MKKLRVLELFAGIGACSKALENLGIPHEIVDAVEIDKFAIKSFNAIHGTNFEPQDITKWDKDIAVDLIMHGSPCTSFSIAGKQAGGDKGSGTPSSLMYETLRIVKKLKPKYVIWENVKNLLSKKHRHNFDAYIDTMSELGYESFYQVLNAKHYGVPQNRERVFTVSIRREEAFNFVLPPPTGLEVALEDVLEKDVPNKYYLSDTIVATYIRRNAQHAKRGNGFRFEPVSGTAHSITTKAGQRPTDNYIKVAGDLDAIKRETSKRVYDPSGIAPTITTNTGGDVKPKIVALRGRNRDNPSDRTAGVHLEQRLEPNGHGTANALTTVQKDNLVLEPKGEIKIRRLTPKECWRLMGFNDEDFEKAKIVNSNTQLYKQAGNSIVVNVLEAILKELLKDDIGVIDE